MKRLVMPLLMVLALVGPAAAQPERYELGLRLRGMEIAYDQQTDAAVRKRAVKPLTEATFAFFANRLAESARGLDQARLGVRSGKEADDAVRWAESLWLRLDSRFVDVNTKELPVRVEKFYSTPGEPPFAAEVRVEFFRPIGKMAEKVVTLPITKLPMPGTLRIPGETLGEDDYRLEVSLFAGERELARREQLFSVATRLDERLGKLRKTVDGWPKERTNTDRESVRALVGVLEALRKKTLETSYPAARLLREAEAAVEAQSAKKSYYGAGKAGQFWLTLALGQETAPVRMFVPEAAKKGEPLPLVIALHGMGGSENMFFDAYGHGAIVRECEKRRWLLVATRSTGFLDAPLLPEIIDELGRLYPVDKKRVYLVGHSMGAAHAVAAACLHPERYAAVAALGGAGLVKASDALQNVAFFVGVGTEDFARTGAKSLHDKLKKAGVKHLEFHEYADCEHLLVVQVGLGEVFGMFEKTRGGK